MNKLPFEEDKVVCVFKRASCNNEDWKAYEQQVESEMEMSEMLEDFGNILEAANRLKFRATQ